MVLLPHEQNNMAISMNEKAICFIYKYAYLFAKIVIIREFSLYLHPNLTKVDSRHDSTNHASMLVLAAPRIMIVYEVMELKKRKIKYSAIFFICWFESFCPQWQYTD